MVLSCLRCMAAEEGSDTVMKRSCQPSLCVNRREGEIVQAVPGGGRVTWAEDEVVEGGRKGGKEGCCSPRAAVPWG